MANGAIQVRWLLSSLWKDFVRIILGVNSWKTKLRGHVKSLFILSLFLVPSVSFVDAADSTYDLGYRHAQIFANVVQKYCVQFRDNPSKLDVKLKEDGFKESDDYDDTFEKFIESVDYAVTPDKESCTTDVLLKPRKKMLFEVEQIESTLVSRLNLREYKSIIVYELSCNDKMTKVIKKEYVDDLSKKYLLIFPLENQGEYYMTFDVYWERNKETNKAN